MVPLAAGNPPSAAEAMWPCRPTLTRLEEACTDGAKAADAVWQEICQQNWRVRAALHV